MTHLVSQPEFLLAKLHTTTEAFSYAEPLVVEFTREFEANATQTGTTGGVNVDAGRQLTNNRPEMPGFETSSRGERAASSTPPMSVSRNRRRG